MTFAPVPADQEHDYVLIELGKTLGTALDHADDASDFFELAMQRLPALLQSLSSNGLVLAKGEAKTFRGQRRRKIRSATWRHLGALAKQLDMTRPQLLRALMRMELGVSRRLDQPETK